MISERPENAARVAMLKCKTNDLDLARDLLERARVLPEGELRDQFVAISQECVVYANEHTEVTAADINYQEVLNQLGIV
jgi:hypothetical protein